MRNLQRGTGVAINLSRFRQAIDVEIVKAGPMVGSGVAMRMAARRRPYREVYWR